MLKMVISGFQTGADQAGILAAQAAGIPTGGWMPKGYLTLRSDGQPGTESHPEFAHLYGAMEHPSPDWVPRTEANARDSDATIWFGSGDSRGYGATMRAVRKHRKRFWEIRSAVDPAFSPGALAAGIRYYGVDVLNVAGNRETSPPSVGEWVERYLAEVFRLVGEATQEGPTTS